MKTEQPTYNAQYFIDFFEAIPDEEWTIEMFQDVDGKCCALGHCGWRNSVRTLPGEALVNIFGETSIADTNDGENLEYPQTTPKARIMAALRDIQKKESK